MKHGAFENSSKANRIYAYIRLNAAYSLDPRKNNAHASKHSLEYLRDHRINYHLPAEQICRIQPTRHSDDEYLGNFGKNYEKLFQKLIDKFVQNNPESEQKILYDDVLFHLNFIKANKLKEVPTTTQNLLKILTDYVIDDTNGQPLILSGQLGSGKSSIISTFASSLFLQLFANDDKYATNAEKHAIVVRFIGIDGKSIYLRGLLKSICLQLNYIRKGSSNASINEVPDKLVDLKAYFKKFLTENTADSRKIILILDSLQDLVRNDNSYKLDWLPKKLSKNCKVILSLSSECSELMNRLRRKYTNQRNYVTLPHLNKEQGDYMIRKLLALKNYRLNADQTSLIASLVDAKPVYSLHLKLLSEGRDSNKHHS